MNEMVHIGNSDISIKEYKGQRVVTFKDIDLVHGRPDGTARKRFADNKERFIEGEDYFVVKPADLENARMSEKRTTGIDDVNQRGTALITEQGYLMLVKSFTDDLAWQVQRQLVNSYFKVGKTVNDSLSPGLQMLQGLLEQMVQKELEDKERDRQIALANETAQKAIETTEIIKEAVQPVFDNWREIMTAKINKIQKASGISHSELRAEIYAQVERRGTCDLSKRLRNMKQRMADGGYTKTAIEKCNKMDVIEADAGIKEIFGKIVAEYEIKYCA